MLDLYKTYLKHESINLMNGNSEMATYAHQEPKRREIILKVIECEN